MISASFLALIDLISAFLHFLFLIALMLSSFSTVPSK